MTENKSATIQIPKHKFLAKFPTTERRYSELDLFRNGAVEGVKLYHHPYTSKKKSVAIYRIVFLTFAILFGVLGVTTLSLPSTLSCGFFSLPTTLKGLIMTLCIVLSLASFLLGISLRTDKEAIVHSYNHWRRKLKTYYARKRLSLVGPHRHLAKGLRQTHKEVQEKMREKRDETLHLIGKIGSSPLSKEEKETLLNQAIAEFHERLKFLAHGFKHDL